MDPLISYFIKAQILSTLIEEGIVKKSAGRGEMLGNLVGLRYSDKFHSQTVNTQHQLAVQKIPPKCHILECAFNVVFKHV